MRRLFTIFIYHYFQTAYSNNRSTSALQHKEPSKYHDLCRITDVHPFINVFESCHEMLRPSSSYNLSLLLYCFVGFLCHDWQPLIVLSCLVFWILAYYSFKNQVLGFITIDFSFDFYFWYVPDMIVLLNNVAKIYSFTPLKFAISAYLVDSK